MFGKTNYFNFPNPYYFYCNLETIPYCISVDNLEKYPAITSGDFLYERLVEIGLIKK